MLMKRPLPYDKTKRVQTAMCIIDLWGDTRKFYYYLQFFLHSQPNLSPECRYTINGVSLYQSNTEIGKAVLATPTFHELLYVCLSLKWWQRQYNAGSPTLSWITPISHELAK